MGEQTRKELLFEAQTEQIEQIAQHRIKVLKDLDELQQFGGKDDYNTNILAIVNEYGNHGIALTKLREVLPDAAKLKQAIQRLTAEGKITTASKGRSITVRPATT
jgi:hypothetical protein